MIVDNQLKPLGDARYLLSPGDLFALHQIPEIVNIGIHALKIEGRYKDENYVALTVPFLAVRASGWNSLKVIRPGHMARPTNKGLNHFPIPHSGGAVLASHPIELPFPPGTSPMIRLVAIPR